MVQRPHLGAGSRQLTPKPLRPSLAGSPPAHGCGSLAMTWFVLGPNGVMYQRAYSAGVWGAWHSIGAQSMVAATPGLTYVSAANRFDVFIPGANGVMCQDISTAGPSAGWHSSAAATSPEYGIRRRVPRTHLGRLARRCQLDTGSTPLGDRSDAGDADRNQGELDGSSTGAVKPSPALISRPPIQEPIALPRLNDFGQGTRIARPEPQLNTSGPSPDLSWVCSTVPMLSVDISSILTVTPGFCFSNSLRWAWMSLNVAGSSGCSIRQRMALASGPVVSCGPVEPGAPPCSR